MMNNKLTEEQQKLIVDNYRLLRNYITKTINNENIPKYLEDEFISDTFLKFCISALKYKKEMGFKFSTYAYGGFSLGLKNILGNKNRQIKRKWCYFEDEDKLEYEKVANFEFELLDNFINEIDLIVRDKLIIKDYYYNKTSFRKIGEKYNLSKEATRLVVKRALRRMKLVAVKKKLSIEDFYS